jgi:hypothetical protein
MFWLPLRITPLDILDELGDIDLYGTTGDAGRIHAVEATM